VLKVRRECNIKFWEGENGPNKTGSKKRQIIKWAARNQVRGKHVGDAGKPKFGMVEKKEHGLPRKHPSAEDKILNL